MRARRKVIVLSLGLSLVATLGLGNWVLDYDEPLTTVGPRGAADEFPARLNEDPRSAGTVDPEGGGAGFYVVWSLAIGSSAILLASIVLFRVEVRKEKAHTQDRETYRRNQREYTARLRGPPRENT